MTNRRRGDANSLPEELGTQGYPEGTHGYPNGENEDGPHEADPPPDAEAAASNPSGGIDLDRFLPPREAVKRFTCDLPAHGGLPDPAPSDAAIRKDANEAARKRVQIGLKLSPAEASELEEAADAFGVTRTTLARMLVVGGAREIVARAKDSGA